MQTECNNKPLQFQAEELALEFTEPQQFTPLGSRQVVAQVDGYSISSDGGGLLLREVERSLGMLDRLAQCFGDGRDPAKREHSVRELLAQRIFGLALGYEDLNDHEQLRHDPLLATLVEKKDPLGQQRKRQRDAGVALAGKSTLNRLEMSAAKRSRYHKITHRPTHLAQLLVDLFIESFAKPPARIVLDLDTTADPLHGQQQGAHYDAHYGCYCFLPLYIFCQGRVLCARLLTSDVAEESVPAQEELERIVPLLRQAWPKTRIVVRGDSAFARDHLMNWCERERVDYVFGLAQNSRLRQALAPQQEQAAQQFAQTKQPAKVYAEFEYCTNRSWSCLRRVIGKAEHQEKGPNPRFVVTTLRDRPRRLYERQYCPRGDCENRIKEQKLDLFSERTSCHLLAANQLRLWLSTFAYVLLETLRREALEGTELAQAQAGTIRQRLLKVGAQVRVSVRRVLISLSRAWPGAHLFHLAAQRLAARGAPAS